jgi:hypothetical protein
MGTIDRVVNALAEWRAFLDELAAVFAGLRRSTAALSLEDGVERAAAQILPLILHRTSAEDAWYSTFASVLGWYLESAGHDPHAFREVVRTIISGRFASWSAPDPATADAACMELGCEVARALHAKPPASADALSIWRGVRKRAFANSPAPRHHDPVRVDGHRRYIEGPERARDPERAARMAAALAACRASAQRGEPLTFERLAAWQTIVLGENAEFRTTDAYAKGGRERYAIHDKVKSRFVTALEEANAANAPACVRAARVYLDVCFFHPFVDGNARAARLALDHVITRAGLALIAAEPLFTLSRSAADADGAWSFAWLVEYFAGPSALGAP